MKGHYKNLTTFEKDFIFNIYTQEGLSHNEKIDILSKKFEVTGRSIRTWANRLGIKSKLDNTLSPQLQDALLREVDSDTDILLITSAQNKTSINFDFLKSLENYKDYWADLGYKAQIVVIPIKYRNPTSLREDIKGRADDWWMDEINPYLYYSKIEFGDTLISADSRIVPTASNPLNGYESLAAENHLIIGHPRIHLKPLPRFKGQKLRIMSTTGCCTLKKYSKSKAGDKAYIHHSYGFVVLEKKNPEICYPPRSVKVESDGSFSDLNIKVTKDSVTVINSSAGIVYGDIHLENLDDRKMKKTQQLLDLLKPKEVIFHDIYDGSRLNPHEKQDLFIRKQKIIEGKYKISGEVDDVIDFLKEFQNKNGFLKIRVIQSNHDNFLDRHVCSEDWRKDLHNSEDYLKYALIQQTIDLRNYGNIIGYLINDAGFTYIKNNESHFINKYQVGQHGNYGVNGAKGAIVSFKRLNHKMIIADKHTPCIEDGLTVVGVSCYLWQYYNSNGLSSWAHADSIIHDSGKNQLIIYDEDYEISNLI